MNNLRYFFLVGLIFLVSACNRKPSTVQPVVSSSSSIPTVPYAELVVASIIEMGTFKGEELEKTVDITMKNVGTDKLYIRNVLPECGCTQLVLKDSVILPGDSGIVSATLDLNGYPVDTIRKEFGILSNDRFDRVKRVILVGIRQ